LGVFRRAYWVVVTRIPIPRVFWGVGIL
jgi:hypothetical protein